MINLEILDKESCYCYSCIKENIAIPLTFNSTLNRFEKCNNDKHKRNNVTFRFDQQNNQWKTFNGYSKQAISFSDSNTKTAKYMREHNLGLFNPEFHQKCIDTQIKNGTFNMLNPDFSKRHHDKMKEAKTGIFSDSNQQYIHSREASLIRAKKANQPCHQRKRQETLKKLGVGIYDPKIREKGRLKSGIGIKRFKIGCKCNLHINENLLYLPLNCDKFCCWSCYKEKFISNIQIDFFDIIKKDFINALFLPTLIEDNKDIRFFKQAWEQILIENKINWFVYIKFYISTKGRILPLVVGKSGSLLVNAYGSDISFSMDPDDGPARRFLNEQNLNWYTDKILVIPVSNEEKAYQLEYKLQLKYNLFGS